MSICRMCKQPTCFSLANEASSALGPLVGGLLYLLVWGRRVHWADRHRVSTYYTRQLIFINSSWVGSIGITACVPGCAVGCVVVFVVLSVLDMVGEILWSIISISRRGCGLSHACWVGIPFHAAHIAGVGG